MKFLKTLLSIALSFVLLSGGVCFPLTGRVLFAAETVQEDTAEVQDPGQSSTDPDQDSDQLSEDSNQLSEDSVQNDESYQNDNTGQNDDSGQNDDPDQNYNPGPGSVPEQSLGTGSEDETSENVDAENSSEAEDKSADNNSSEKDVQEKETSEKSDDAILDEENPDQGTIVQGASEEGNPDEILIEEEGADLERYIPGEEDGASYDNDDIFAAYVNRELGLEGSLKADTGDYHVSEPARKSNFASTRLTGYNRTIYGLLLGKIRKVAAGEISSTVFALTLDEIGLSQYADGRWSAEDLGVDSVRTLNSSGKYVVPDDAKNALLSLLGIDTVDLKQLHNALLSDCPYDLYWYDKVSGVSRSMFSWYIYSDGTYKLAFAKEWKYYFYVSADYSVDHEKKTYVTTTDPQIGLSVQSARSKALAIVEQYKDKKDYEKLDGYRKEICDLVSYNSDAANNSDTPYGDPWQLICTFDDDPDTKVVCEGYSKSFQYLCDLSSWNDIFKECISVTGFLHGTSGPHMWNIVTLRDGTNYLVDLTNCDTGMVGQGNGGRNLFLVGTGDSTVDKSYASGSALDGYTFPKLSSKLHYMYDNNEKSNMFDRFGTERLELSPGKVTKDTVATGAYNGNHEHLYLPVEEELSTCTKAGHGKGYQCAICGELDENTQQYPLLEHTPGEWKTIISPTCDTEGLEKTSCTVCGAELQRSLPKLLLLKDMSITLSSASFTYDGNAKKPTVTVFSSKLNRNLVAGKDYVLSYSNNINAGTAGVVIAACPGTVFDGSVVRTFSIGQYSISETSASIILSAETLIYDGNPKTPAVIVTVGSRTLVNGKDYSISYSNNINAGTGTAKVKITGKGNYKGSVTKTFSISKASQTIKASAATGTITAGQSTTVTLSGAKGTKTFTSLNTSVAVVGKSTGKVTAKKAGTVKITATSAATGNYQAASKVVTIKVLPPATKKLTAVNLAGGIKLTWVKVDGANGYDLYRNGTIINSGNTLSYTDTKATTNGRKYTYTIIARAVTGTSRQKKTTAVYRLSTPTIKSIVNKSGRIMSLTWGKNEKASGYQIQYSLYSGFTNSGTIKTVTVSNAGTVTKKICNLTKGKVWYVRIRAYKTAADGSKSYSQWKSSSCKIKK